MYAPTKRPKRSRISYKWLVVVFMILAISGVVVAAVDRVYPPTIEERIEAQLQYYQNVDPIEQAFVNEVISAQNIEISASATISAVTTKELTDASKVLQVYVPVTNVYAVRQKISATELATQGYRIDSGINQKAREAIVETLGTDTALVSEINLENELVTESEVVFIPVSLLDGAVYKLLQFDDVYYLDSYRAGALFRSIDIQGEGATELAGLQLDNTLSSDDVYKVNMSGVTALTRVMMRKLNEVGGDPLYFSQNIGDFLADADLTHVSNEVSFLEGCSYSNTLFCSPPEYIETLSASGVDLVEITGNHNNDFGAQANADTIALYRELGWDTVGGGLNTEDAALPVIKTEKGSNIAFLAYNFPDSPNGGAIAGPNKAGANSYDIAKIEQDIAAAKTQADFVIVNIQYWECYSYPDGYIEYPICDKPIGEQEAHFKEVADLGADMVIGSSAHQPQTYEMYNGVPIYYGLGNMYFDQTSWPGTERGIILTHYFDGGRLLQTKLTPTVFGTELQPRPMTDEEAQYLLTRLSDAR